MAAPAIVTVDDEPEVLRAVERDLAANTGRTIGSWEPIPGRGRWIC